MTRTARAISAASASAGVPKEYVHKHDAREVLLTGWRPAGPNAAEVGARWPELHGFYEPRHGVYDPLLFTETVRQTVPLLSHAAYGVPFGHRLLWNRLSFTLPPTPLRAGPVEPVLRVARAVARRRGAGSDKHDTRIEATLDGARIATAALDFSSVPPGLYARMRGRYADAEQALSRAPAPGPAVTAYRVGRERAADVVLSPTPARDRWMLRTDPAHPVLFDHPLDHVPGMLLLEAARQAAHLTSRPGPSVLTGLDAVFTRYVELDEPCWITARALPCDGSRGRRVRVVAEQDGAVAFSADIASLPAENLDGTVRAAGGRGAVAA
ncbi:ScbA/BarX family gamma-butyrolactone biosynthesis protein [Streptomyces sp. ODS28]|uniref:ScbA/BarX family gamma-butyrolactone biosynthesis protein n=1 Tax=Streptomyces sp. ODS28 TaxID=3136688 RepID=UPI0031EF8BF8